MNKYMPKETEIEFSHEDAKMTISQEVKQPKTSEEDTIMSNDIIGLANLLKTTNTSGMDLPAIMAMCKDNGFGGGSDFTVILILLLLFNNGGLFGNQRAEASTALGGAENLQMVTSLYDRISASQATTTQGFSDLNTYLCTAISTVLGSIRDQGDRITTTVDVNGARNYEAIRTVGDKIQACCCSIEKELIRLGCAIQNVGDKVDLSEERTARRIQDSENKILLQMERNQNAIDKQFCTTDQLIKDTAYAQESARKDRLIDRLQGEKIANDTADSIVSRMQSFNLNHFPTKK